MQRDLHQEQRYQQSSPALSKTSSSNQNARKQNTQSKISQINDSSKFQVGEGEKTWENSDNQVSNHQQLNGYVLENNDSSFAKVQENEKYVESEFSQSELADNFDLYDKQSLEQINKPQMQLLQQTHSQGPSYKQQVQGLNKRQQEEIKARLKQNQREGSEPARKPYKHFYKAAEKVQELIYQNNSAQDDIDWNAMVIQRLGELEGPQARGKSQQKFQDRGFYKTLIPSFTNHTRKNLYKNDPKYGFTYVNWDIEEELWRFQAEIEYKFARSDVNLKFRFPKLESSDSISDSKSNKPGSKNKFKKKGSQGSAKAHSGGKADKISQILNIEISKGDMNRRIQELHMNQQKKVTGVKPKSPESAQRITANMKGSKIGIDHSNEKKSQQKVSSFNIPSLKLKDLLNQEKTLKQQRQMTSGLKQQTPISTSAMKQNKGHLAKPMSSRENQRQRNTGKHINRKTMVDFTHTLEFSQAQKMIENNKNMQQVLSSREIGNDKVIKPKAQSSLQVSKSTVSNSIHKLGQMKMKQLQSPLKRPNICLPLFQTKNKRDKDDVHEIDKLGSSGTKQNMKTIVLKTDHSKDPAVNYQSNHTDEGLTGEGQHVMMTEPIYNTSTNKKGNINAFFQSYCNQVPVQVKSRNQQLSSGYTNSDSLIVTGAGMSSNLHKATQKTIEGMNSAEKQKNNLNTCKPVGQHTPSSQKLNAHNAKVQSQLGLYKSDLASNQLVINRPDSQRTGAQMSMNKKKPSSKSKMNSTYNQKVIHHLRFKSTMNGHNQTQQLKIGVGNSASKNQLAQFFKVDRNDIRQSSPAKTNLQMLNSSSEKLKCSKIDENHELKMGGMNSNSQGQNFKVSPGKDYNLKQQYIKASQSSMQNLKAYQNKRTRQKTLFQMSKILEGDKLYNNTILEHENEVQPVEFNQMIEKQRNCMGSAQKLTNDKNERLHYSQSFQGVNGKAPVVGQESYRNIPTLNKECKSQNSQYRQLPAVQSIKNIPTSQQVFNQIHNSNNLEEHRSTKNQDTNSKKKLLIPTSSLTQTQLRQYMDKSSSQAQVNNQAIVKGKKSLTGTSSKQTLVTTNSLSQQSLNKLAKHKRNQTRYDGVVRTTAKLKDESPKNCQIQNSQSSLAKIKYMKIDLSRPEKY